MQDPRPAPAADPRIERAVESVFGDPELRDALVTPAHDAESDWLAVIRAWIRAFDELLDSWTRWITDLRATDPLAFWAILLAMVAVLVLLLWHLIYTVRIAFRRSPASETADADTATQRRRRSYEELRRRAGEYAARGETREAVRQLVLALFALLEARKALSVANGWTTREILGLLAQRIGHESELRTLTTTAELASYGPGEIPAEQYARLDATVEELADSVLDRRPR